MDDQRQNNNSVDISRLNRHERRRIGKEIGQVIPGRNMPFIKKIHKTLTDYNNIRSLEIEEDLKNKDGNRQAKASI